MKNNELFLILMMRSYKLKFQEGVIMKKIRLVDQGYIEGYELMGGKVR